MATPTSWHIICGPQGWQATWRFFLFCFFFRTSQTPFLPSILKVFLIPFIHKISLFLFLQTQTVCSQFTMRDHFHPWIKLHLKEWDALLFCPVCHSGSVRTMSLCSVSCFDKCLHHSALSIQGRSSGGPGWIHEPFGWEPFHALSISRGFWILFLSQRHTVF